MIVLQFMYFSFYACKVQCEMYTCTLQCNLHLQTAICNTCKLQLCLAGGAVHPVCQGQPDDREAVQGLLWRHHCQWWFWHHLQISERNNEQVASRCQVDSCRVETVKETNWDGSWAENNSGWRFLRQLSEIRSSWEHESIWIRLVCCVRNGF